MSNYLIALILSIFLASAGGVSYFQKHPEQRHALEAFVNNNISTHHEKEGKESHETPSHGGVARAPEINASSGINAIAILIGALLLASEKYRVRRS
ncbi:MAG TPA: VPEID-CTERM sorting domain-containing protein [Methylobacter sp.]